MVAETRPSVKRSVEVDIHEEGRQATEHRREQQLVGLGCSPQRCAENERDGCQCKDSRAHCLPTGREPPRGSFRGKSGRSGGSDHGIPTGCGTGGDQPGGEGRSRPTMTAENEHTAGREKGGHQRAPGDLNP